MKNKFRTNFAEVDNQETHATASGGEISRREFGILSLVTNFVSPLFKNSPIDVAPAFTQLSRIIENAHPLLTKAGIEIIFNLASQRVNNSRADSEWSGLHEEKRLLTPSEEAGRFDHFSRRFEYLREISALFDQAFDGSEQESPFADVIRDYERHIREEFLEVQGDTIRLIDRHVSDQAARTSFITRLDQLRLDILRRENLEKTIDELEMRMANIRHDIENFIGKGWTYPSWLLMLEVREDRSIDDVISALIDGDDVDADEVELFRNQIQQYEPIVREMSRCKRFCPLNTYLSGGRGSKIFGSLKGLAAAAGDYSGEHDGDEVFFAVSQFHLIFSDQHSARLFPHGERDSLREYLSNVFSAYCTPSYQANISNNCGFNLGSLKYFDEDSRINDIANPDFGVTHYLLDIRCKHQYYQLMRAALSSTWPEMARQLGSTGLFASIESSLKYCERVLRDFLNEVGVQSPEQINKNRSETYIDDSSLDGIFLGTEFRAYIEAVMDHQIKLRQDKIGM